MSSALTGERAAKASALTVDGPSVSSDWPKLIADGFLTLRQRAVFGAVESFGRSHGYSLTLHEIAEVVRLANVSNLSYHLSCVQDKECLGGGEGRPRPAVVRSLYHPAWPEADETPISIVSLDIVYVPLIGRIAAGNPIYAEQSAEDIFPLPRQLVGEGNLFLLEVSGDSMVHAAITDGDWIVIREQPTAENGEIVAAMIDGDATVKTFTRADDHVWLIPANPDYKPILGDDVTIIGKAVAVLRRL